MTQRQYVKFILFVDSLVWCKKCSLTCYQSMAGILQNNLPHYRNTKGSRLINSTTKRLSSKYDWSINDNRTDLPLKKRIKGHETFHPSSLNQESEDIGQNHESYISIDHEITTVCSVKLSKTVARNYKPNRISPSATFTGVQKVGNYIYFAFISDEY